MENNSEIKLNDKHVQAIQRLDVGIASLQGRKQEYLMAVMDTVGVTDGEYDYIPEKQALVRRPDKKVECPDTAK